MESAEAALEAIEAFVNLHRKARRRALGQEDRLLRETLDEQLRDVIDGARPAPKRIHAPTNGPRRAETPAPPAKVDIRASGPSADNLSIPAAASVLEELQLSPSLAEKVQSVDLPRRASTYTPSKQPAHLDAYYENTVDMSEQPMGPPRHVVDVDGTPLELAPSALELWNVGQTDDLPSGTSAGPGTRPEAASSGTSGRRIRIQRSASIAPAAPTAMRSYPSTRKDAPVLAKRSEVPLPKPAPREVTRQDDLPEAIVHLLEGGTRRGFIAHFDGAAKVIELLSKDSGAEVSEIPLDKVLVIFFGRRGRGPASPKEGLRLEVTLVNDRRLIGFSKDYTPSGSALTVVPEADRGRVDRVWVPAWSVKALTVD